MLQAEAPGGRPTQQDGGESYSFSEEPSRGVAQLTPWHHQHLAEWRTSKQTVNGEGPGRGVAAQPVTPG